MARNEEKQLGQLNRLYLHREQEERHKKCPPRPKLHTLGTAAEVAKHLPSIIRDIDISIKQSQVTCYTQEVSEGYLAAADQYRREYEAFVRKMKLLDPSAASEAIPWTDRPYDRKRPASTAKSEQPKHLSTDEAEGESPADNEASSSKRFQRIESALLLEEEELRSRQQQEHGTSPWLDVPVQLPALQDLPLQFDAASLATVAAAAAQSSSRGCISEATRSHGTGHLLSSAAETVHAFCVPVPGSTDSSCQRPSIGDGSIGSSTSGLTRLCQVYGDVSSSDDDE